MVLEGTLGRGQRRRSKSTTVKPYIENTLEDDIEVVIVELAVRGSQLLRTESLLKLLYRRLLNRFPTKKTELINSGLPLFFFLPYPIFLNVVKLSLKLDTFHIIITRKTVLEVIYYCT